MKCPMCEATDLVMTTREGVEIDYCPKCRGVWLDRGELDKIIDRMLPDSAVPSREPAPGQRARYADRRDDDDDEWRRGSDRRAPYRKRRSFLGELFDF